MIPNALRKLWADGRPAINGWLTIPNSFSAEVMAAQGFDSLTVDLQHGLNDYSDALTMLQAMRASGVTPLVRVPWLEPGAIMKSLDAGAYGVICPMVNSRAQAEELVSYMRYPPLGSRSFGPTRVNYSAGADYAQHANDEVLCIAMIETAEAVAAVEEITSTPGVDGVYIGPADLTLGVTQGRLAPGFDREETELVAAIQRILKAAQNNGIRAGIHCGSTSYAAKAIGWGFDLVTITSDARMMASAASESVRDLRERLGQAGPAAEAPSKGY